MVSQSGVILIISDVQKFMIVNSHLFCTIPSSLMTLQYFQTFVWVLVIVLPWTKHALFLHLAFSKASNHFLPQQQRVKCYCIWTWDAVSQRQGKELYLRVWPETEQMVQTHSAFIERWAQRSISYLPQPRAGNNHSSVNAPELVKLSCWSMLNYHVLIVNQWSKKKFSSERAIIL